jgi:exoribonuclease II
MSTVKVDLIESHDANYCFVEVDGKKICNIPTTKTKEIAHALELIFDAMDIENTEVRVR